MGHLTRIEVTQDCIDIGRRGNCVNCPVALAIRPHINLTEYYIKVSYTEMGIYDYNNYYVAAARLPLPTEAKQFIADYDANLIVKPFSFDIEIPSRFLKGQ